MNNKDYYIRSKGRIPDKIKCNGNLIDDGFNCINDKICKRDANSIKCTENNIVKTYQERLQCNKNEDKINDLCYKRCNSGYTPQGSKCVKGVDNIITNKVLVDDDESIKIKSSSNYMKSLSNVIKYIKHKLMQLYKIIKKFIYENFINNKCINTISFMKYKWYIIFVLVVLTYYFYCVNNTESINSQLETHIETTTELGH
jgi:hypothetical protein